VSVVLGACSAEPSDPASTKSPALDLSRIAAGGLVEPVSEERVIIPQISGRLARVEIEEGDKVSAGQLIAEIENADLRADMAAAAAEVDLRQAELERLRHGARAEEIAQAVAGLAAAESAEHLAEAARSRDQPLLQRKLISQAHWDQTQAELEMARAERERAAAALKLLRIGARVEDIRAAEARLAAANAMRDRAKAQFGKSQIRSPIDGVVLKRDLREGETAVALSPLPLARIGDISQLHVRADIDELDIARVRVGQTAEMRSDAYAGQHFPGKVIHVSQRMGRRNSSSDDPAEKQDAKILEALILLEGHPALPIGLRVDVFIDVVATPSSPRK
ncbi:MAG TPA: efflux RND transporter periplasmic adaptor subunit, partial [Dokdonella sp.]|uniref:HlyD family secretion protein n=1 Tax=Dokdonella sp. TaxID=2291710 RepID=UPI002D7EC5C3